MIYDSCSTSIDSSNYQFEPSKNNVLLSLRPMDENPRRHEQVSTPPNPNCIKSLAFVRKSGGSMQKHGLGIDSDKMYEDKGQLISKEKCALFNFSKKNEPKNFNFCHSLVGQNFFGSFFWKN